ncbi:MULTISPECIES: chemotaxis protein CheX [unclassified Acinetobacter]|uniref:chemotaxis protein CheX n=1 Tax=unclassified Acinetobacter TaxID=196816 RepID=UPI0035B8E044
MKEQQVQVFVDIVKHYFKQFGHEELEVETPYILENTMPKVLDFTGVIGVSGAQRGVVYFTATTQLLRQILESIGESEQTESNFADLVGEIANTISGNARTEFGAEFHISVPLVFKGSPESVILPKSERLFIIPITWQEQTGELAIYLQG